MPLSQATDVFTKLSVGDGLVTQIPALIISLAAGLLVSKGGTRGSAEQAVLGQLVKYPRALFVAGGLMFVLGVIPGLPFVPFALLGSLMAFAGYTIPARLARQAAVDSASAAAAEQKALKEARESVKESLKSVEIELCLGKQLSSRMLAAQGELMHRVTKMRRKFASNMASLSRRSRFPIT